MITKIRTSGKKDAKAEPAPTSAVWAKAGEINIADTFVEAGLRNIVPRCCASYIPHHR